MPMAYSPDTKLFYVPANEWGMDIWNEPITYKKGAAYLGAGFTIKPLFDDYIGALRAIDPKTGKIVWEVKNTAPLWGGVLTTAGNLVFSGTPEGYLKAVDAKTGKELWKFQTGSGVVGAAGHLGEGRRAVCCRRVRLGWRRAAVGWRGRQEGQGHRSRAACSGCSSCRRPELRLSSVPIDCDKERGRFQPAPFRYGRPAFMTTSILHRIGTRRTLPKGNAATTSLKNRHVQGSDRG